MGILRFPALEGRQGHTSLQCEEAREQRVMQVKLLGGLANPLGRRVEVVADSVAELLGALALRGGQGFAARLYCDSSAAPPSALELHRDLRVLVNGRSIAFLDGANTGLREQDVVTLHQTGVRGYPGG
jgi:molybdopterin converting factor small subunit